MDLLSLFRRDALRIDWAYDAHGTIWRVQLTKKRRIVGECRNQEKKSASYFCIDEQSGKPLWENLVLSEPWWVGMEGVADDVILLHSYAKPDMPEHKGILAYDAETGTQLWHNDDLTFWFTLEQSVYAYRDFFERRVGYELNLQTGEFRKTFENSLAELQALRLHASELQTSSDVVLPEILAEGTDEGVLFRLVNKTTKGRSIAGNIEFVRDRDFFIFNYHIQSRRVGAEQPTFENHLFVLRLPHGNRLFFDTIGSDLTAPAPDSFFMRNGMLFILKDQHILTSVRLWK